MPDQKIGTLSPGMRQCVAVLLAIGHRPDLLVLDEPVASLDPGARRHFLRMIGDLNAQTGQTVILSSHICSDIERICSDVAILHGGRIVLQRRHRRSQGAGGARLGHRGPSRPAADVLAKAGSRLWLRNWRDHDLSAAARVDELNLEELFLDITA